MKQVETEGETLDEAITKALSLLGVGRDEVSLEILAEEETGASGADRQNARVRATIRDAAAVEPEEEPEDSPLPEEPPAEPAPVETAPAGREPVLSEPVEEQPATDEDPAEAHENLAEVQRASVEIVEEILRLMGVESRVAVKPGSAPGEFILDIQGDSGALLIGRRGQTLEALQHIVSRIVAERVGPDGPQPIVDAEDYRGRRVRTLEDMALRLGEKAKRSRKTQSIDALSARDRRVVHLALKDDPWLTTKSLGQGAFRRLLIVPEGDRKALDGEADADE